MVLRGGGDKKFKNGSDDALRKEGLGQPFLTEIPVGTAKPYKMRIANERSTEAPYSASCVTHVCLLVAFSRISSYAD